MLQLKRLKHLSSILFVLLCSCINNQDKEMEDKYLINNQVNFSIGYYVYSTISFNECVNKIASIEDSKDIDEIINISREMIDRMVVDLEETKNNKEFIQFYRSISLSDTAERYIDLYYSLSLSKLQKVVDGDFSFNPNDENYENYIYFRDCYLRLNSSEYFVKSWFIPYSYRVTDGFLKLFIDKKDITNIYDIHNNFIKYDSFFFNVKLDNSLMKNIIQNVSKSGFSLDNLTIQDKYFYKSLEKASHDQISIFYRVD